jgi:hypothetical protein
MSAKSERPKNRRVKLVGGGYKWTRGGEKATGGSLKARRRALRQNLKRNKRDMTVSERKAIKEQIAALMAQKDGR